MSEITRRIFNALTDRYGRIKRSAEKGSVRDQYTLARMYHLGDGIEKSISDAWYWYEQASKKGLFEAKVALDTLLVDGVDEQDNNDLVKHVYRVSDLDINADWQSLVGITYLDGKGDKSIVKKMHHIVEGIRKSIPDKLPQTDCTNIISKGELLSCFLLAGSGGFANKQRQIGQIYEHGHDWYISAAEQGDAESQWRVGLCCSEGAGVVLNEAEAARWYGLAAEQGHEKAQSELGRFYFMGIGVERSDKQAMKYFEMAADKGDPYACNMLANMYRSISETNEQDEKALALYQKASGQGMPAAQYNLGMMYLEGKGKDASPMKAVILISLAAKKGFVRAQYQLGVMYHKGEHVMKDDWQARYWFLEAARNGDKQAPSGLAMLHKEDSEILHNMYGDSIWFEDAANMGSVDTRYHLAKCYLEGRRGFETNVVMAIALLEYCALHGKVEAQVMLGKLFGEGVVVDFNQAMSFYWYQKASEQGDMQGKLKVAIACIMGSGTRVDHKRAAGLFKECATEQYVDAWAYLGVMYLNGLGVWKNTRKAVKWFMRAAEQGHAGAQGNLARHYYSGKGVSHDPVKAYIWYSVSVINGMPNDDEFLEKIMALLTPEKLEYAKALTLFYADKHKSLFLN